MFSKLYKYVRNLSRFDGNTKANILGSDKEVELTGKAWYNNAESIQIAQIHLLNEFSTKEVFTKDEFLAFRKGLNALPKFMSECYDEYDLINSQVSK